MPRPDFSRLHWVEPVAAPYMGLPGAVPAPPARPVRRRRVFPWSFLAVQALFIAWIATGVHSAHADTARCADQLCKDASDAGTAIGVAAVVAIWVAVDVLTLLVRVIVLLGRRKERA